MASSPTFGVSLRTYPNQMREHPDSHVSVLFDPTDGRLLALIAGDELNMLRTAIPVGAAARRLASSGARVLAMIGSGRQARGQAGTILQGLPDLERIVVFSPTEAHREAYAKEIAPTLGIPVDAVDSARAAIEQADVVALNASARQPVFEAEWLQPGALALSINSGQLPPAVILSAQVVLGYKSDRPGQPYGPLIEAGEWSMDAAASYGEILTGARPGRTADDQRIIADLLGMGVWDAALLRWAYDWAVEHEVGTDFHLSS
jgi:ornithine cyclodeaminase/alanine dehydrogenase-like protein (mu-crystallin family)